ncbi:MAG: hypothetical protein H6755_07935 [Candidatus Omnitrophica bacterium]|nr:hypothetical protein [Candidatus Omnitrophota bacterium]MCB9748322.1 hypothetical protein [Candidatus Omnitrophota bacterium]
MFKLLRRIIFIILIIGIFIATKNIIAKFAVVKGVESATGLNLKIEKFDLGLANTHIGITNLKLLNPEGFVDEAMFIAPDIFVDYEPKAFLKGKVHLEEVRLVLDQLVVIKNKEGELNLASLNPEKKDGGKSGAKTKEPEKKEGKKAEVPDFQIDKMLLKIGKVVYKDYSKGADPQVKEFNVNIYETFEGIDNTEKLIQIIMQKALAKTALANLGDFDVDFLKNIGMDSAVGSFKGKLDSLKDKIKLPFGN